MENKALAKKWFLTTALAYLGTPYVWGGDDPSGFDCSGFVIECLKSAGILKEAEDYSADGLMHRYEASVIDRPCEGALLFSLDITGRAYHVVICLDENFQIGASGGDRETTNPGEAWQANAYVKIRPLILQKVNHRLLFLF